MARISSTSANVGEGGPFAGFDQVGGPRRTGEQGEGIRAASEDRADDLGHVGLHRRGYNTATGQLDRRGDNLAHRHMAECSVGGEQAAHDPGRGNRAHADVERLLGAAEVGKDRREVHLGVDCPGFGRLAEEVEYDGRTGPAAVTRAGKEIAAAAQRGKDRLGDTSGAHGGERGVDRRCHRSQERLWRRAPSRYARRRRCPSLS